MTIKGVLFAGVALSILSAAPALAGVAPHVHVTAMHPGSAINKTAMHHDKTGTLTYTFSIYTTISTKASYNKTTPLAATYYTWDNSYSICDSPKKETITLSTTKTAYAALSTGTETYSEGCSSGPTTFYGDIYDLTTKKAKNKTDTFSSDLKATIKDAQGKFKASLILDVSVAITK
jgi:hypothetical protein